MKYGKLFALFIALFLVSAGQLASAQTADTTNPPASGMQERGGRHRGVDRPRLNLTADQKAKMKSLHEGVRQQIQTLRNDTTLSAADKQAKIRSLRESTRQQFRSVLTPEQQQQLQSARQNRGEGRGFGARGRHRGHRGGGLERLGLTPEQQSQIQTIHQSTKEQMGAIRNDTTLSTDQKEAKLRSLFQSSHSQVSGLLTPEQQQKLKEGHRGGHGRFGGHGHRGGFPGGSTEEKKPEQQ